jgi:hypothetical protein
MLHQFSGRILLGYGDGVLQVEEDSIRAVDGAVLDHARVVPRDVQQ